MHFALPPRKTSHPPPYAFTPRQTHHALPLPRNLSKYIAFLVLGFVGITFIRMIGKISMAGSATENDYDAVIVTMFDPDVMTAEYISKIKENRETYALEHGYKTFYPNMTTYLPTVSNQPRSWALIPALRHALTLHPTTPFIFSLSPHALITGSESLKTLLTPDSLSSQMLRSIPVVPPDSVIRTFSHLQPSEASLILTQTNEGLDIDSMIFRNNDWAKYLLDMWFDPLLRSYGFQRAERHALEHIVQWHPTILAKIALVSRRSLNSKGMENKDESANEAWRRGDFVVGIECEGKEEPGCQELTMRYWRQWKEDTRRESVEPKREANF